MKLNTREYEKTLTFIDNVVQFIYIVLTHKICGGCQHSKFVVLTLHQVSRVCKFLYQVLMIPRLDLPTYELKHYGLHLVLQLRVSYKQDRLLENSEIKLSCCSNSQLSIDMHIFFC